MSELIVSLEDFADDDDRYDPPPYGVPGRIFVHITNVLRRSGYDRYELEIVEADIETSVFWINEGVGFDYWFGEHIDIEHPGYYVVEGVTGEYVRGDGWMTDDDEYWDYDRVRKATPDELMFGLAPLPSLVVQPTFDDGQNIVGL